MVTFPLLFDRALSLKDLIECLGIPSDEVDMVLVNSESVDFSDIVKDGDRVSLYPVFESFDISSAAKVRSRPLRQPRFILDVHLGKLANHLRMLGFDTIYRNDFGDEDLIAQSVREGRILLSKDRTLLKRDEITRGYCVKEKAPRLQLIEVLRRFDLSNAASPFTRCIECNSVLRSVTKDLVIERLPLKVQDFFSEFQLCETCDRIYWKGSHYMRMQAFIDGVIHEGDVRVE